MRNDQKIDLGEALGRTAGLALAPLALVTAALRDARTFHPRGHVYRARAAVPAVLPLEMPEAARKLAERLAGPVIARVSSGWWKNQRELPDVLGVALRFRLSGHVGPEVGERDQDLLFVSAPSVARLPISALTTDVHDFLNNRYFAISPYEVEGLGRVKLELEPLDEKKRVGDNRIARLDAAVEAASAGLRLVVEDQHGRRCPLAEVQLEEHVFVDQDQLRFSPFNAGRGLDPVGFVHGLRWATYVASRLGERLRHGSSHAVRT